MRPDGSSCFPYASDAIRDIYQVTPEAVREDASAVLARIHPEDYAGVVATIQQSAATLNPWQHEYRVRFADGTVRWLHGNSIPNREADGSVIWHGFITDITHRKHAEQSLLEAKQLAEATNRKLEEQAELLSLTMKRLKLATEAANIGIWSWDLADGKVEWDVRMCDWYQIPNTEPSPGYDFWRSRLHPDDLGQAEAKVLAARQHNAPYDDVFRIVLPDGSIRHLHTAAVIEHDANGQPVRMIGINRDITAQQALEAKLRSSNQELQAIFDAAGVGIALMHRRVVLRCNRTLEELFGYGPGELDGMPRASGMWMMPPTNG